MVRKIGAVVSILALSVMLLAVSSPAPAASVLDKSVIIVGTEGTYPPFQYYDENNVLTGFDVEMVYLIGEKLGREIEFVDMAFDGLIPALITNRIDMIAAAMNATAERSRVVDFSDVYQAADSALLVRTGDRSMNSPADMNGRAIGVQLGTTEDIFLTDSGFGADIRRYQRVNDAVRELLLDRIDGVLLDTPVANGYLESDRFEGYLEIAFKEMINDEDEGFSLAMRKNDGAFLEAVNNALRELNQSSELGALKDKYRLR